MQQLIFHLYPSWAQVQKSKKWISACGRIGHKWHSEIIPDLGRILTYILLFHKLASSVNLYRFTHFLDFLSGSIFANCLLGKHPQSPLNGICDTGYSFILNAFVDNLYRFTHFLDFLSGSIFANCLLGKHPQSPLNGICDTGYSFILNAFVDTTSGQIVQKTLNGEDINWYAKHFRHFSKCFIPRLSCICFMSFL